MQLWLVDMARRVPSRRRLLDLISWRRGQVVPGRITGWDLFMVLLLVWCSLLSAAGRQRVIRLMRRRMRGVDATAR